MNIDFVNVRTIRYKKIRKKLSLQMFIQIFEELFLNKCRQYKILLEIFAFISVEYYLHVEYYKGRIYGRVHLK